jgi:hypothetical protein
LPEIASGTVNPESMTGTAPSIQTTTVLSALNEALAKDDVNKLASCFFAEQAFSGSSIIAAALRHLVELRGLEKKIQLIGNAKFSVMSPMLVSSFLLFFSPVLFHLKP